MTLKYIFSVVIEPRRWNSISNDHYDEQNGAEGSRMEQKGAEGGGRPAGEAHSMAERDQGTLSAIGKQGRAQDGGDAGPPAPIGRRGARLIPWAVCADAYRPISAPAQPPHSAAP